MCFLCVDAFRDFGDESFIIPTDFEDTDNFSAGGAFSDAHTLGGEGSAEWADEDGAFVTPSTLKHFERQLRSISSDFSGRMHIGAHVANGFDARMMTTTTTMTYPKIVHQAFLHVQRTRFHPGEDCIVCIRPILAASGAAAHEAQAHGARSAAPSFDDSSPRGNIPSVPEHYRIAGYRVEAFSVRRVPVKKRILLCQALWRCTGQDMRWWTYSSCVENVAHVPCVDVYSRRRRSNQRQRAPCFMHSSSPRNAMFPVSTAQMLAKLRLSWSTTRRDSQLFFQLRRTHTLRYLALLQNANAFLQACVPLSYFFVSQP